MAGSGLELVVGAPCDLAEWPEDSLELQFVEGFIEQMKAVSPDIVRGIPVFRVLQCMPCKWLAGERKTFYGLSEVADEHLDEFWSHSWCTMSWLKYVNILSLNNGFPAFVAGSLCGLGAFSLGLAGFLPIHHAAGPANASCTIASTLGYYLTLFLWQSRRLAFLDLACISQTDEVLKTAGLVSMGAFLRRSQSLLILWDETWITRFWCVFEMAGFIHSKGHGADRSLRVCPVFTGPAFVVGHMGLSVLLLTLLCTGLPMYPWGGIFICAMAFPCLLLLARVVIQHGRSIDVVQYQVRHFTVQQCSCSCCDRGHVHVDGSAIMCDRVIILRCISAWFGSVAKFESHVRSQLLKALVYQLANQAFSYWRIVQAASPVAFAILDMLGHLSRPTVVLEVTLTSATYLFCLVPSIALILLRLAYRVRNFGHGKWAQWLLSAALLAVGLLLFGAYLSCELALHQLSSENFGNWVPANFAQLIVMGAVTLGLWRRLPAIEMSQDPSGGPTPAPSTKDPAAPTRTSL